MNICNPNNPAVKRILREIQELKNDTNTDYKAYPLEDNIFEWHFTIRGPQDSDFSGGIYHGRIILPSDYPFKPPNFVLLTPNGRFETGVKICLTVSAHHPEHWQPSWSIRTVLVALIGFMPTEGKGAIGALDLSSAERKDLAKKSIDWKCPRCNSHNKYALGEPSSSNTTTTKTNSTTIDSNDQKITLEDKNNESLEIKNDEINKENVNSNDNIKDDKTTATSSTTTTTTTTTNTNTTTKKIVQDDEDDENDEDNLEMQPIDLSHSSTPNITIGQNLASIQLNTPIGVVRENNTCNNNHNIGNNTNNNIAISNNNNINNNNNSVKEIPTQQKPTSSPTTTTNNNNNQIKHRNTTTTITTNNVQQPQPQPQQQPQQQQQRTFFNQSTIQIDRLIVFLFTILLALIIKRLLY